MLFLRGTCWSLRFPFWSWPSWSWLWSLLRSAIGLPDRVPLPRTGGTSILRIRKPNATSMVVVGRPPFVSVSGTAVESAGVASSQRLEVTELSGAFSWQHWLILAIVVILLFGAKRLPEAARSLGKSMRIFKAEVKELQNDGVEPPVTPAPPAAAPVQSERVDPGPTDARSA